MTHRPKQRLPFCGRARLLYYMGRLTEAESTVRDLGLPLGYFAQGRRDATDAAMNQLLRISDGAEFQVAEAYAFMGDVDKAFEWLDRASVSDPGILWLRNDPLLQNLTKDPRYATLLRRLNYSNAVPGA